jgi:hypothetical protein
MESHVQETLRSRIAGHYRTAVVAGISLILASLLIPRQRETTVPDSKQPTGDATKTTVMQDSTTSCLQPPLCGDPTPASIEQLITNANRYNRKTVQVSGKGVMLKIRKSDCGEYANYVLIDKAGRFVTVIDYTNRSEPIFRRDECVIKGFYRADIHLIDVCKEEQK